MKKNNMEIRIALMKKNLPLYMLADILGKSEPTITRMMRHELPDEDQKRILALIEAYEA